MSDLNSFLNSTIIPPFDEWSGIVETNHIMKIERKSLVEAGLLENARFELFQAALNYTANLITRAENVGIFFSPGPAQTQVTREEIAKLRFAMLGHQPTIYHSGIYFKNFLLNELLAKNSGYLGFNVAIDTDEGNVSEFFVPYNRDHLARVEKVSLTETSGVMLFQHLATSEFIGENIDRAIERLQSYGEPEIVVRFTEVAKRYIKLAGFSSVDANAVIRRSCEKQARYLELPYSELLQLPCVVDLIDSIIPDLEVWVKEYNRLLDEYRTIRKIKNPANPFPNLKVKGDLLELPFWIVDKEAKTRESVYIDSAACKSTIIVGNVAVSGSLRSLLTDKLSAGKLLVPKAMLTTLLLRTVFSDLFIHGLGGAKYDGFTDYFIERFYKIKSPRFVTASASKFLFEKERVGVEKAKEERMLARDMHFHPERFLGKGFFDPKIEGEISILIAQKQEQIRRIVDGKSRKESTAVHTQEVKRIEYSLKELIAGVLPDNYADFKEPSKTLMDTYYFREFPFFLFGGN